MVNQPPSWRTMLNGLTEEVKRGLIKRVPLNTKGTDYIGGDIHGCFDALEDILERIGFNPEVDRFICTGDLVDRGPQSYRVFDLLEKPWLISARGNHEEFALWHCRNRIDVEQYREYGGAWFIDHYHRHAQNVWKAFNALPLAIELEVPKQFGVGVDLIGIVHADIPTNDWAKLLTSIRGVNSIFDLDQKIAMLTLMRDRLKNRKKDTVQGVKYLVHGHSTVKAPMVLGNVIYLDTGLVYGRALSIFNTRTEEITIHQDTP